MLLQPQICNNPINVYFHVEYHYVAVAMSKLIVLLGLA